ncbi:MAG: ATP-binding cassette domain-containing protein [Proteobacteria bacterium]|jgi:energy-coupling factor transport system ATP-binding protein|nr:ATP-binding cassette domain-containing protein [Pseudomonadota bacterium]
MISFTGATYRYAEGSQVGPLDLEVGAGERVLLTGQSGCGKSTLLRMACGLLQRHGTGHFEGLVELGGHDPAVVVPRERPQLMGFVSQDPSDQIIAGEVGDEIAFAMESVGFAPEKIEERIAEVLDAVGLDVASDHGAFALSTGQRQRLVVAAAIAPGSGVLLLDEPLAHLDPAGAFSLMDRLAELANRGITIVVAEHRLEQTLPWCDRLLLMNEGRMVGESKRNDVTVAELTALGLKVPELFLVDEILKGRQSSIEALGIDRFGALLANKEDQFPLESPRVDSAVGGRPRPNQSTGFLCKNLGRPSPEAPELTMNSVVRSEAKDVLVAKGLCRSFGHVRALRDVDLTLKRGERVALLGANGAGKSTLIEALSVGGPQVVLDGRLVDTPQDPDLSLFCSTVRDELAYGPQESGLSPEEVATLVDSVAEKFGLAKLFPRSPHALSRGERLRLAVAAAVCCEPQVLLLDEPTSGQDHRAVEAIMGGIEEALPELALLFATHDVALVLRWADRVVLLDGGQIVDEGSPAEVLGRLGKTSKIRLPPLPALCHRLGLPVVGPQTLAGLVT